MLSYDTAHVLRSLEALSHSRKVAFAASCVERLIPVLARCPGPLSRADLALARTTLDDVWAWSPGAAPVSDWEEVLAPVIPDDSDPGWQDDWAFPQSTLIALAHALCVVAADEAQPAQWASNQVYEAADSAAQIQHRHLDLNQPGGEEALRATSVVQAALQGILDDLESARLSDMVSPQERNVLRSRASSEGEALAALLAPRA